MESLATTNVWLAILAIASLVELLIIVGVGLLGYKMYRQVMTTIENVERGHIAPLRARVDAILDEVQMMTAKLKHAQQSVGDALGHASSMGGLIAETVKTKTWPIRGIINGVRIAAITLMKNGEGKAERPPVADSGT